MFGVKSLFALTVLTLLLTPALSAQDDSDELNLSGSVGADFVSNYIFRGFDVLDDRAAFQPYAGVGFGDSGIEFGLWMSFGMASRDEPAIRELDEYDLTFSWGHTFGLFDVSAGHISYIYPDGDGHPGYTAELFAGLGHEIAGLPEDMSLSASATLYWDYDQGNDFYFTMGADFNWAVLDFDGGNMGIDAGFWFGYNNGQFNVDANISDVDLHAGVSGEFSVIAYSFSLHYVLTPEDTINPEEDSEVWFSVGASFSF